MPNGGEDNCITCPFNSKNKGVGGYGHALSEEPDYCTLRELEVENAAYTYCSNHPFRNPEAIRVPVGPVFTGGSLPPRRVAIDSPDSEEIRDTLLKLLSEIPSRPVDDYPMGIRRWEVVIWQLGEFREKRAVSALERLSSTRWYTRFGIDSEENQWVRALAKEALHKIEDHREGCDCPVTGRFPRKAQEGESASD